MKNNAEVEMEVFRTGDYGSKGEYSEADLDRLAADYRPDLLEAPLTFDHAQSGPAYGWVSRLRREGDRLVAALKDVPAAVTDLVRRGAYKRRSVELFHKLPHTGRPYLRAVSLLGAATPEVKGLRDVCFASRQDACTVEFAEEQTQNVEARDAVATGDSAGKLAESGAAEFASDRVPFAALIQQEFAARTASLFADLRRDGYCLTEDEATALARLFDVAGVAAEGAAAAAADGADLAAKFAEDAVCVLDGILRRSLLRAPLGEAAGGAGATSRAAHFSAGSTAFPDGIAPAGRVDPRSMSLHGAALQIMQREPGTAYRDALVRVAQGR